MGSLDTLVADASVMLDENRATLREALTRLTNTTRILDNFADQVTRRPLRMLTGVKPPAPDTGNGRP
jgi:ABC-type transporter Mla subunit MlaD